MATGVNPTTVAVAGPIMAKALGLRWSEDRAEVVEYLNKFRQLLYSMYSQFHLFDDVFHCICVEGFAEPCTGVCGTAYRGFTLPNDVEGVEAVFRFGFPLTLHSRWRESHTGIGLDVNTSRIAAVLMAEQFCTERDISAACRLRLFAEHPEDDGKCVTIEGIGADNKRTKARIILAGDGVVLTRQKFLKVLSVALSGERKGSVSLMDNDRKVLSIYTPSETVPLYRRMKVPATCTDATVLVQGNKRFQDIYFDHDIVEVGNRLIIEAAGRYFKYGETTTEEKEIKRSNHDLVTMTNLLKGDVMRQQGAAKQDGFPFSKPSLLKSKSLTGYSR